MVSKTALRIAVIAFAHFLLGLYPTAAVYAQQGRYSSWGSGTGMMGGWGMGWFGGIFMIVFWILILIALVLVIKWIIQTTGGGKARGKDGSRALDILKERYARGEIDKSEFETMKQDLRN